MKCEGMKEKWKDNIIVINAVRLTIFWFSLNLAKWHVLMAPCG